MIYELRVCDAVPGKPSAMNARSIGRAHIVFTP